jgi:hypothetical protein
MQSFVDQVLAMTGLHNKVDVVIDPATTGCACAATVDFKQVIGVDPKCLGPLRDKAKFYNWRTVGILTHEVGLGDVPARRDARAIQCSQKALRSKAPRPIRAASCAWLPSSADGRTRKAARCPRGQILSRAVGGIHERTAALGAPIGTKEIGDG